MSHNSDRLRDLHGALIDIVSLMNRPEGDQALIDAAGINLERSLFPLLVVIDRRGPIGVVDLAGRVGRDYTTVSRQIAKLERLGLVERKPGATDRRIHEAMITPAGRSMNEAIDTARERRLNKVLELWSDRDVEKFAAQLRKFADRLLD